GDVLDRKIIRWFLRPYFSAGWSALRAMNRTAGFLLRRLEQATGVSALAEISDFFSSMSELFENFQSRVDRAHEVLRGRETAFVLVSGPEEQVLGDADYLSTKMAELRMPLKGVVLNRVHRELRPRGGRGLGGDEVGPEAGERVAPGGARAVGASGRAARERGGRCTVRRPLGGGAQGSPAAKAGAVPIPRVGRSLAARAAERREEAAVRAEGPREALGGELVVATAPVQLAPERVRDGVGGERLG